MTTKIFSILNDNSSNSIIEAKFPLPAPPSIYSYRFTLNCKLIRSFFSLSFLFLSTTVCVWVCVCVFCVCWIIHRWRHGGQMMIIWLRRNGISCKSISCREIKPHTHTHSHTARIVCRRRLETQNPNVYLATPHWESLAAVCKISVLWYFGNAVCRERRKYCKMLQ